MLATSNTHSPLTGSAKESLFLSSAEENFSGRFPNAGRKKRWRRGRVLAKYLFLEQLAHGKALPETHRKPCRADVERFPAWLYKEIEILPEANGRGNSILSWNGRRQAVYASFSYSGDDIAVGISENRFSGLDLEHIEERRPEFYRHSFTPFERNYVDALCDNREQKIWAYTLLWTIKEAGLKASRDGRWNLWNLPLMEIDLSGCEEKLLALYRTNGGCTSVRARAKGFVESISYRLTLERHNTKILTAAYHE